MMKKVLLFYNPYSGNGMFKNNLDKIIERYQEKNQVVIPVRASKKLSFDDYLKELNKETYKDEYAQILAAGGDGTINICVNAMIKNGIDLPLGIFPAGTANDFAYYFNIPGDINGMLKIASGDNYTYADVGCVNNKYFVNVAALGQMVDVSQRTDPSMKNSIGVLAYYLKGLAEVPTLKPLKVKLTTKDEVYDEEMYFMVVMNGKSAGGFKNISPLSEINDGLLDVILFRSINFIKIPALFFNVLQGKHTNNSNVLHFQTDNLIIESDVDISTDIDGEHGEKLPLNFSVLHNRLRIATLEEDMGNEEYVKESDEDICNDEEAIADNAGNYKTDGNDDNTENADYSIVETDEYERLVKFFVKNQLEFDGDEEVDTDILNVYKCVKTDDELIGGAVLAKREGRYIIDGIAVDEQYRSAKIGTELLSVVIDKVKSYGGDSIYLVARAPGFFKNYGFNEIDGDKAPNFFECRTCPQYGETCHPEIMKYDVQ